MLVSIPIRSKPYCRVGWSLALPGYFLGHWFPQKEMILWLMLATFVPYKLAFIKETFSLMDDCQSQACWLWRELTLLEFCCINSLELCTTSTLLFVYFLIIKIFEQLIFRDLAGAHSQLGDLVWQKSMQQNTYSQEPMGIKSKVFVLPLVSCPVN